MDPTELINKDKLRCDNIISVSLIVIFLFMFVFFRLILLTSLIIYPLFSLFMYGAYYIYKVLMKNDKFYKLILGIMYVLFSSFMFWLLFSYPSIPLSYIVIFLSIPVLLIGFAAILKGSIVDVYSPIYRMLNILIGCATLIVTILALFNVETNFLLSLISILAALALNGILRSGLYLSEYGLSLKKLDNIKYVFFIMDNLIVLNLEEDYKQ